MNKILDNADNIKDLCKIKSLILKELNKKYDIYDLINDVFDKQKNSYKTIIITDNINLFKHECLLTNKNKDNSIKINYPLSDIEKQTFWYDEQTLIINRYLYKKYKHLTPKDCTTISVNINFKQYGISLTLNNKITKSLYYSDQNKKSINLSTIENNVEKKVKLSRLLCNK